MVYLSLYGLVALGVGWKLRPKESSWKKWGLTLLKAVFWLPWLILIAIFAVLAVVMHKGD